MKLINPNEFNEYEVLKYILSDSGRNDFIDSLRVNKNKIKIRLNF